MKNYGRNSKDIQEKSCFISDKVVSLHSNKNYKHIDYEAFAQKD